MNRLVFTATLTAICLTLCVHASNAQTKSSDDLPKFELGAEFTSLTKPDFDGGRTEPGFGGRFTYNLNKNLALEAAGHFFPHKCRSCSDRNAGTITEGLFGVKAGKRFQKWGIFGKARPGFVSFSGGGVNYVEVTVAGAPGFDVVPYRVTSFAFDAGGVVEFYPSRRIVTRFDAGDTIIHYARRTFNFPFFDPGPSGFVLRPVTLPAKTLHNFQFIASVGFRF